MMALGSGPSLEMDLLDGGGGRRGISGALYKTEGEKRQREAEQSPLEKPYFIKGL